MDVDSNLYNTIRIGDQEWMKENLRVSRYRNKNPIETSIQDSIWENSFNTGLYGVYENFQGNNSIYGKLYNYYAVKDSRGLCPINWHIPTRADWIKLENYLGGKKIAGGKLKSVGPVFGIDGLWIENRGATNESGFTGLPGGSRTFGFGEPFKLKGETGIWWSSDPIDFYLGWIMKLDKDSVSSQIDAGGKRYGYSVRCIKD